MRLSVLSVLSLALASSGDRLTEFRECTDECINGECPRPLPLCLKLLLWSCADDCDYRCQQLVTDIQESLGDPVHQYHGKWPFIRLFGIQEPASVLFSVLNFLPNAIGYTKLRKVQQVRGFGFQPYYLLSTVAGMNAWVWSSVFHTRDFVLTERLDYFSAIASILYGLFLATMRLFRLDLPSHRKQRYALAASCGLFYAAHVYYLSFIRFNYAYNMMAGVVLGLAQTLLWIYGGIKNYGHSGERRELIPAVLVVAAMLGSGFELFDFSPFWRTIDAHSLWHLATVVPQFYWYKWMLWDLHFHKQHAAKRRN